jgi:hypothetical protein
MVQFRGYCSSTLFATVSRVSLAGNASAPPAWGRSLPAPLARSGYCLVRTPTSEAEHRRLGTGTGKPLAGEAVSRRSR